MIYYPAVLFQNPDQSNWGVIIPDLPGCILSAIRLPTRLPMPKPPQCSISKGFCRKTCRFPRRKA
ncbi:hypothetical protein C5B31_08920 [Neisseria gonorrhoeae]|uniref:Uncharacterized protein n=1 Tax=Neisseria gonorrhoeae (strain ATCC 700825 / FA 1090) TaxID=242231 RepID=A0A0H4ISQ2_NEIG1|nr:hypothetical protein NGO_03805 [Neisseria gonorrhoeae FA 1090]AZG69833.1 hypothetical protein EGH16_05380 [Neisseria gonorrhoeae]KDM99418.1 hypothetical protein AW44_02735 [Neisseria gonorrhoeae]OOD36850.1 hypothetical protein BWP02_04790 [Neisseria gonorrhoeae]PPZ59384.1 hypothetical protein C5B38_04230 [Neisseria gonorrhoeae]